mmetsp:Transcript_1891/g.3085  ORF Transcript_1891/g.3085 Transcript_1891/m.3085 type:complete len:202 (+) Transcript_1891:387-992(+)
MKIGGSGGVAHEESTRAGLAVSHAGDPFGSILDFLLKPQLELLKHAVLALRAANQLLSTTFHSRLVGETGHVVTKIHDLAQQLFTIALFFESLAPQTQLTAQVNQASIGLRNNDVSVFDVRQVDERINLLQRGFYGEPLIRVKAASFLHLQVVHNVVQRNSGVHNHCPKRGTQASDGPVSNSNGLSGVVRRLKFRHSRNEK